MKIATKKGSAFPLGTTATTEGVNFSVYAPFAQKIKLALYDTNKSPIEIIPLDPSYNKTGALWHIEILHSFDTLLFTWDIENDGDSTHAPNKIEYLLDPYAKEIESSKIFRENKEYTPYSRWSKSEEFDWQTDFPPLLAPEEIIIYEMHVRGFTIDSSSKVQHPGTFLGLIEKLDHLLDLGVTAIELLPVFEFNEREYKKLSPFSKTELCNYWGYSTVHFFAPMNRYGVEDTNREFKELIYQCHKKGLEVYLDVVFNHTAEGNGYGPVYSFKGYDPHTYYMIGANGEWFNFSGCGNTMNTNHPIVRDFVVYCLRHWVEKLHVDGFRFDLASVFYRDANGAPLDNPPIIDSITVDPLLRNTKLIVETWDAGGLYQVGQFYNRSNRWLEWNSKYKDSVRSFIKGTPGQKGYFATRVCGSPDVYPQKSPLKGVNYITCHDGFTLYDLVSYSHKHNLDNGEDNQDGENNNHSWNCGAEGPTDNPEIQLLRKKQMKNHLLALLVSQGIPMILMGDEYGHTKNGNNNTWCHDSKLNWFDWDLLANQKELFEFLKQIIQLRKQYPHFRQKEHLNEELITWYNAKGNYPNWGVDDRFVAFLLKSKENPSSFFIIFNANYNKTTVQLPKGNWQPLICTDTFEPVKNKKVGIPPYTSMIFIQEVRSVSSR